MLVLSVSHGLPVCKLRLARIKLRISDHSNFQLLAHALKTIAGRSPLRQLQHLKISPKASSPHRNHAATLAAASKKLARDTHVSRQLNRPSSGCIRKSCLYRLSALSILCACDLLRFFEPFVRSVSVRSIGPAFGPYPVRGVDASRNFRSQPRNPGLT
jgi:hypothetical protein